MFTLYFFKNVHVEYDLKFITFWHDLRVSDDLFSSRQHKSIWKTGVSRTRETKSNGEFF